jgi:hypothetical protein
MIARALGTSGLASNANVITVISNTVTNGASLGVVTANAVNKVASAWGGGSVSGSLNGGAVQTSAVGIPAGVNVLTIGNVFPGVPAANSFALNGHVRRVRYWPLALAPADLQAVTA